MTLLLKLDASYSTRSVTLADPSVTAYTVNQALSLGSPVSDPLYSRTFDGERVMVTGAPAGMREVQIPLRVNGASVSALQTALDNLLRVADDITRQGGGWLRYRSASGSYVTRYRVGMARVDIGSLETYEAHTWQRVTLALVVDPFGLADPLDITDGFSADSLGTGGLYNLGGADWTAVTGALTNGTVSGGVVDAAANLSTENLWTHTGTPHTYGDVSVSLKHTVGATLTNYKAGVILRYVDASNYVEAYVDDTGAASRIRIDKVVATARTNMVSTALTRIVAGTSYWIEAKIVGNVVTAEHWTSKPTPMGADANQATDTFDSTEAALFGITNVATGVEGRVGIVWTPIETTSSLDDFKVRALCYREITFPRSLMLEGAWGGTQDALAGIYYTASGGTAPTAMLYAWWPRVAAHNMVWNGGGESVGSSASTAYGWSVAAVTGISVAATSVARTTTAASIRTGSAAFEAVTDAATSSGPTFVIYRRGGFRKGVTYSASAWIRAAVGTTSMLLRLGVGSSDRGTSASGTNLTTSWQQVTCTWTAAADADVAWVGIITNAATATTFQFDDVVVFEGTTAPTCELGGFGPGFIPAAAYNSAAASTRGTEFTQTTDADYLVGVGPQGSAAITADTGELEFPILPHLFTPDDYASDEVDVAVFARIEVASTQTSLACAISMASERGTSYGARRYGSLRSGGKTIKLPSSGTVFKPYFLGVVTLKVDRTRPRREWLRLAFSNSGSATGTFGVDYLVVAPVRSICGTQRGSTDAITPDFIASTAETTKVVGVDTDGEITGRVMGAVVEHTNADSFTPDDGLCGEPIVLSPDGAELLVWPSDQVIDLSDSSTHNMAETYSGTVQVAVQPRTHLLRQS